MTTGNVTQLVFCSENVDPDLVSQMVEMVPTNSVKVGEPAQYQNGAKYDSHLGIWKLKLPNGRPEQPIEEQVGMWVELLRPRSSAFKKLRELGYGPYLDCKAEDGSLSLCFEPDLLTSLGELNISLSVWLYEQPRS